MSFGEFAIALGGEAENLPARVQAITRKIGLELFVRVVQKTPVRLPPGNLPGQRSRRRVVGGRARGGWQAQVGSPPRSSAGGLDASGASTIGRGQAVVLGWPLGTDLYLANNVEYIGILEQGRRTVQVTYQRGQRVISFRRAQGSIQAPAGMVAVSVAEIDRLFREVTA